jgi:hypothetical protein
MQLAHHARLELLLLLHVLHLVMHQMLLALRMCVLLVQ